MENDYYRDDYERSSRRARDESSLRNRSHGSSGRGRSAERQDRDEFGRFAGYGNNDGYSRRDERSGSQYDERSEAGRGRSFDSWEQNQEGRFQGSHDGGQYRSTQGRAGERDYSSQRYGSPRPRSFDYSDEDDNGYEDTDGGRQYSQDSQERHRDGRFRVGQSSGGHFGPNRGERSRSEEGYSRQRSNGSRSRAPRFGDEDREGHVDSAGRHYTRESWERAQEGRSLGGRH